MECSRERTSLFTLRTDVFLPYDTDTAYPFECSDRPWPAGVLCTDRVATGDVVIPIDFRPDTSCHLAYKWHFAGSLLGGCFACGERIGRRQSGRASARRCNPFPASPAVGWQGLGGERILVGASCLWRGQRLSLTARIRFRKGSQLGRRARRYLLWRRPG
jgi:hypothetical protein